MCKKTKSEDTDCIHKKKEYYQTVLLNSDAEKIGQ